MNKSLRYGLLGVGSIVAVTVAGIAYVAATFNPNDYKAQIIKAVKDSKQRILRLDGDIKLTFYPSIGASLSKVSLSEFRSDKEFAAIESARVSVALLPLLSKQVVVDEVALSGLKARLIKHKDGTTNIDDLLDSAEQNPKQQKHAAAPPVMLDIASVSVDRANISYLDEGSGAQYAIRDMNLKTGRIAVGVPSDIDLSVGLQANQPKLDIQTQLKTTLTFDLEKQFYQLDGLEMQVSGIVLDIKDLKAKAGGDVKVNLASREFSAQKFSLAAAGIKAKDNFDIALDAPELGLSETKVTGDKLTFNGKLDGASGNIAAALSVSSLAGDMKFLKADALDLNLKMKLPQHKLDFSTQLKGMLSIDPEKQSFQLQGMDLQASGSAFDMTDLKVRASGDANANLTSQEFGAQRLSVQAAGMKAKDSFEANLDAPQISLAKNIFSGDKLTLKGKLDGAFGNAVANMSLPGVEGNEKSFRISVLVVDMDVKQPEQSFKVKLSSPVSGSIQAQQVNLSNLVIALKASGDKLPNKSVSSEMKGSMQIDAAKESVQVNLAGGLLQSKVKAKVGVKGFASPAINFDVDVDQFDADLYMPRKSATAAKSQAKQPELPFDLSALRKLNLDGSLRIGTLKVANVKSSQVRMDVKAHKGQLNLNPLSANLYQGSMSGSLSINSQNAVPSFTINQKLSGIAIAPLMKDAADMDLAEGRGNIVLDLTTQGNTVSALKRALSGNVSVNLVNGAIKGINLNKLVQGIQNLNRDTRAQTLGVDKSEKTDFSEFKASFKVHNGVAHNDDLDVKSTVLRLSGNGDIDIGQDKLDYNAKATLARTEQGRTATLPVNVSGPFDALKFKVDYGSLLVDAAKQKIDEKKEKLKEDAKARLQEELKKGLKDLFK